MKLLNNDFLVLGISALIITTFSVLLYADFTKKIQVDGANQIGTITFKREVAQRKYQGQVVWEAVKQSYPVYNNDSIRTSDNSEAVINLCDGTDINVDENSMIMLSTLDGGININFAHGSISANRQNVTGDAAIAAITIRAMDATVSIYRSNIQLSQLENRELDLTVSEGSASVKTASGVSEVTVNVNEKAIISADKKEAKIVPIKFDLQNPDNNSFLVTESDAIPVKFDWVFSDKPSDDVNLQIAFDRGFSKIKQTKRTTGLKGTTEKLGPGVYYWRLSSRNKASGKTEYSEIRKLNIIYSAPVKPLSPLPGESVASFLSNSSIAFSWMENEIATGYILEVSDSSDFSNILQTVDTPMRRIALENIEPGVYFWRIKSRINTGGKETVIQGAPAKFIVEKKVDLSPPRLIRPAEGDKIDRILFRGKGVLLSWSSDPGFSSFNVELASDNEFKQIIFSGERTVNFAEVKDEIAPGKYFWRVKGVATQNDIGKFSSPASFEVVSNISIDLISPAKGAGFVIPSAEKEIDLKFSWKKIDFDGNYRVQVSRNADFADSINLDGIDGAVSFKFKDQGVYFWRVQLLDTENKVAAVSSTGEFLLKKPVPEKLKSFIVVNSPIKGSRIYIDSKLRGSDSIKYELKNGNEVLVTIRAAGYKDHSQTIKVPAGETVTISPALDKSQLMQRVKWTYSAGSPMGADPVYYKDRIVAAYENGIIAVLSSDGNLILSAKLAKRFESRPVISGNNAYIVDVDGMLFSFNLITGKVLWKIQVKGPLLFKSEPVIAEERIYFATGYGNVEAYNLKGEKLWENSLDEAVFSSVQVYKDTLIVATDALKVYALRINDGKIIWNQRIDGRVITASPLVDKENLYFGTQAGSFYALTVNKGEVLWKFKAEGAVFSTPVGFKGKVYFGTEKGVFYALDSNTGEQVWSYKTSKGIKGSPVSAFNNIMVSDENSVYSLNPENGSVKWFATFQSTIKTSPVFAGDVVVMGLANGEVVSVRDNLVHTVR